MNVEYYHRKWNEIHENAARVLRGGMSHRSFCSWMRRVPDELPCPICKKHAKDHIRKNPPEDSTNLFKWAWSFHNEVNRRKGKSHYDYTSAARRYGV